MFSIKVFECVMQLACILDKVFTSSLITLIDSCTPRGMPLNHSVEHTSPRSTNRVFLALWFKLYSSTFLLLPFVL